MNIDIDDDQKKILLETLAKALAVSYLQGKDNSKIEKLIQIIASALEKEGKMHIFESVFQEFK